MSPYGVIKDRIAHLRSTGQINKSRYLLKRASEDPGGPKFPNVSARFSREILARLCFAYNRRRELIVATRRNRYVFRRMKAYCEKRAHRWLGRSEYRPRIFLDASFIDKNSTGGNTCATW